MRSPPLTTSFPALLCGPAASRHPPLGVFFPCCGAPHPPLNQFPFLSSPRSSHPCLSHSTYSAVVLRTWPSLQIVSKPLPNSLSPGPQSKAPPQRATNHRVRGVCAGLCDIFPLLHTCHLSLFRPFYRTLSHRDSNCGLTHVQSGLPFLMHGSVSLDNCVQACSYHHNQGTEQFNPKWPWAVPL